MINKNSNPLKMRRAGWGNTPIIQKDSYEVEASNLCYSIPVSNEEGEILYFKECTEEEWMIWMDLIEDANEGSNDGI